MPAVGPDRWGDIGIVPTGLTQDRYVRSVEVREINDIPKDAANETVGGRFIFHHMTYESGVLNEDGDGIVGRTERWPIHEVGRNPDIFPEKAGRLLPAHSALALTASHLHANGWRETTAHLEFGFKFFPVGYEPEYKRGGALLGNGIDIDVVPNKAGQEFHSFETLQQHTKIIAFEPHLHAPGVRMCIEAIWGHNQFTLNCVGYDHNWVQQYVYKDDAAPLLPKGTILHIIGFLDTTKDNPNLADTRNWAGGGRRSVSNMFIDLGYSVSLTEEQFQQEMAARRAKMKDRNDFDVGLPAVLGSPDDDRDGSTGRPGAGPLMKRVLLIAAAVLLACRAAEAQTRFMYLRGQTVSPAYEGWWPNDDGSYTLFFGYMNSNWEEQLDVPVGPKNYFTFTEPGASGRPVARRVRRGLRRPGAAHALLSAAKPLPVHDPGARRLRGDRARVDARDPRDDREGVRIAPLRLPHQPAGDLDRGGRRLRQPGRRPAHQRPARARRRGRRAQDRARWRDAPSGGPRARPGQPSQEEARGACRRRPRSSTGHRRPWWR